MGASASRSPSPQESDRDLVAAAECGDAERVLALLEDGARPARAWKRVVLRCTGEGGESTVEDAKNCETALTVAIISGREDIVRELLRGGANPNEREEWAIAGYKKGGYAWTQPELGTRRWPVRYEFSCALALALGRGADVTNRMDSVGTTVMRFIRREPSLQEQADKGSIRVNFPGAVVVIDNPKTPDDCSKLIRVHPSIGVVRALLEGGADVTDEVLRLATLVPDRRFVEALEQHLVHQVAQLSDEQRVTKNGQKIVTKDVIVVRKPWLRAEREGLMKVKVGHRIFCVREYPDGRGFGRCLATNTYGYFSLVCVKDYKPDVRTRTWPALPLVSRPDSRMSETLPSTQSLSTGTFFDRIRPASVDGHRSDRDRPTSSLSLPWNRATKQSPLRHSLGDCDDTGLATTRGTPYRRGSASPRTSTDSAFTTGCFSFGTQSPVSPSPVLGPAQHPVSRSPVLGPTRHPMSHSPALSPRQQPVSRSPVLGPTQHPPRPPNCAYTDSAAATLATSKRAQSLIRSPTVLPATPFSASGSVSNAVATSARATSPTTTTATAAEAGFPEHSPLDEDVVVAPARIHSLSYLQSENFGSFSRDSAGPDRSLSRLSMKHGTAAAAAAVPARTSTSTTTTITAPSLQHNAVGAVSVSTDVSHDCTLHEKDVRPASSSSSGRLVDGDADGGDSEVMTSAAVHAGSGLQKVTSKAVEELEQREADETLVGNGQEIAAGAEDQSPGGAMEDVVAKEMILGSDVGVFKVFEVDENGAVVSAPQA